MLVAVPVPGGRLRQKGFIMVVSRRTFLRWRAWGAGVTVAGFTLPLGQSVSTADWISTSSKPKRFTRPLYVPQPVTPMVISDECATLCSTRCMSGSQGGILTRAH